MERAELDQLEQRIRDEVAKRFPGVAQRVAVLQYGDDPVIEPGELLVRVTLEAPDGSEAQEQVLQAFEREHGRAIKQFRHDLNTQLPEAGRLEFRASSDDGHGPRIVLGSRRRGSIAERALEGTGELTPVMARLGRWIWKPWTRWSPRASRAAARRPSAGHWPAFATGQRTRNCASGPARSSASRPTSEMAAPGHASSPSPDFSRRRWPRTGTNRAKNAPSA